MLEQIFWYLTPITICLILWLLYKLRSYKISQDTLMLEIKIEKENNEAELQDLKRNQDIINEISRIDNTEQLIDTGIRHLRQDYDFDYAVFSLIDFEKRQIVSRGKSAKEAENGWISESLYNIDDSDESDILVQIVRNKCTSPIVVIGSKVLHNECGMTFENLNQRIYKTYDHQNLARVFVPIVLREKKDAEPELDSSSLNQSEELADQALGVIEAGYRFDERPIGADNIHEILISKLSKSKIQNLFIYADNFAQLLYRNMLIEHREQLRQALASVRISNQKEFLKNSLMVITKHLSIEYGNFSHLALDTRYQRFKASDVRVGYDDLDENRISQLNEKLDKAELKGLVLGVCNEVIKTEKIVVHNNITDGLVADSETSYLHVNDNIKSEIGIPVFTPSKKIMGALVFSSSKPEFFTQIHRKILQFFEVEFARRYLTSKRYASLKELNKPISIFGEGVHGNLINQIGEFFNTNDVTVWCRSNDEKENKFNEFQFQQTLSNQIQGFKGLKEFRLSDESGHPGNLGSDVNLGYLSKFNDKAVVVRELGANSENQLFEYLFAKKAYRSLILLRIPSNGKYEFLITVFSRKKLDQVGVNEYGAEFALTLREKFETSVQLESLVQILTSSAFDNQEKIVELIVDKAHSLLDASVVGFFPLRSGKLNLKKRYIRGKVWEEQGDDKAVLSELILKNGTRYFNSIQEVKNYFADNSARLENSNFLITADIQSIAGIRLKHANINLGVLMIEFNRPNVLNNQNRELIQSIKAVSERLLFNCTAVEKHRKELSAQIEILQKQEEAARKEREYAEEAEERSRKEAQVLTEANMNLKVLGASAAYFDVFQIVNHDIDNYFTELDLRLSNTDVKTQRGISDIKELINNLLDLFNSGRRKREFFNVNQVINQLISVIKRSKDDITFDTSGLENGIPSLKWNKAQFSIMIYNLVNNAIYALRTDKSSKSKEKTVALKSRFYDNEYIISVWDNGKGIKKQDIDKVFDLKYSTKGEDGHGIGLYFVKNSLFNDENKWSADIECASVLGEYTEFTISIPAFLNKE